jgi:transcriptional regulator with XRE-family HTH domain
MSVALAAFSNPRELLITMNHRPPLCYLRTHRRVWALTQAELAALLGLDSPSQISRLEHTKCKRGPSYETALACQVLFGIEPRDMYPSIHRKVEERVMRACYHMHQGLENSTSLSDLRKRELLELALRRATTRDSRARTV